MYYNITVPLDEFEYQSLAKEFGKENIVQAIKKVMNETLLQNSKPTKKLAYHRLGGSPPFHVPEDFDIYELLEFEESENFLK